MNFQPDFFFFFNCTAGKHFTLRNIKERAELRRRRGRPEFVSKRDSLTHKRRFCLLTFFERYEERE